MGFFSLRLVFCVTNVDSVSGLSIPDMFMVCLLYIDKIGEIELLLFNK